MKKKLIAILSVLIIGIIVVGLIYVSSGYAELALHSDPWMQFQEIVVAPYFDYSQNHDYFFLVGFSAINPSSVQHYLFLNTAQLTIPGYTLALPYWEALGSVSLASCTAYYLFITFDAIGSSPQTMPSNDTMLTVNFTISYSLDSVRPETFIYANSVPVFQLPQSNPSATTSEPSGPTVDICQIHTQAVGLTIAMVTVPLGILTVYYIFRLVRRMKADRGAPDEATESNS